MASRQQERTTGDTVGRCLSGGDRCGAACAAVALADGDGHPTAAALGRRTRANEERTTVAGAGRTTAEGQKAAVTSGASIRRLDDDRATGRVGTATGRGGDEAATQEK